MAFTDTPNPASRTVNPASLYDANGNPVTSTNPLPVTGTLGGASGFAEDVAHVSGDTGTMALAVRRDADTSLVDTTGDYAPLQVDANGYLKVNVKSGTSTGVADNTGFTDGTTPVTPAGYIYDEVAGTALTENDVAAGRINVNRSIIHTIEDGATRGRYATVSAANALKVDASGVAVPITDNSGSLTVDNAGTFATQDSQKIADNAGFTDGTTPLNPVGFIYDEVAGTALTENDIVAARADVKRAQVMTIEDATTRGQRLGVNAAGSAQVQGQVASDGVAAGNPLLDGARASTSVPTSVSADGDVVAFWASLKGALQVAIRDINSVDAFGEVQAAPTAYTLLARLKDLTSTGTPYDNILLPTTQLLGSSGAGNQYVSDTNGWNKLVITLGGFSTNHREVVALSWSTTVSDQATCKTAVDSITTIGTGKFFAPDGVVVLNTVSLWVTVGRTFEIDIDPLTPVKTYGVGVTNSVPGLLVQVTGLRAG